MIRRFAIALALLLIATAAVAQFGGRGRGGGGRVMRGMPDVPGSFTFCRLMYDGSGFDDPSGSGWSIEYPRAEENLLTRLTQLTLITMSRWSDGTEGYTVVVATDPELFQCPFLMMASPASAALGQEEVDKLREYLLKGGFLWGDDFWGDASWNRWVSIIQRVLPEYPIVDIPPSHPFFSTYYTLEELPQIPTLNRWSPGMSTALPGMERETATAHLRGIFDENGRLLVLMTHNTDIADGWEREADLEAFFLLFSAKAYAVGVNAAIWSMTR